MYNSATMSNNIPWGLITFITTCMWTSFGIGIAGISNKSWIFYNDTAAEGLWTGVNNDVDYNVGEVLISV